MKTLKSNSDRLITVGIVLVSLLGIIYFGYQAFYSDTESDKTNPFEYNIEHFKQTDTSMHHYTEIKQILPEMQQLSALATGQDGSLIVAGDKKCIIYNLDGKPALKIPLEASASALAVDQNGDIYCAVTDHVVIYDKMGAEKQQWPQVDKKSIITSIAVTRDAVLLADAGTLRVWQFDKKGDLIRQIGRKDTAREIPGFIIPSPYFDLAVDPDGFLWVANTGRLSLENYTLEGDLRTQWGEAGMDITRFCGCCNPSHFTILEDGSFVTAEKGIARVKVYNRIGELKSVVAGPNEFTAGTVGLDVAVDSRDRIYVLDPKRGQVRIFAKKQM